MKLDPATIQKANEALKGVADVEVLRIPRERGKEAEFLLQIQVGDKIHKYAAEYKRFLNTQTLWTALDALRGLGDKGILFADYVNPKIAKRLREMNIRFLDTAGNIFLNEPNTFLFIIGNRPEFTAAKQGPKAFHAAALKVVFTFLCRPELINEPIRKIARQTGVAVGTVAKVHRDLRARRHVVRTAGGIKNLVNRRKLCDEWVLLYPTVLRPKLLRGRYAADDNADWWTQGILPEHALWGGEVAAARVTKMLKPVTAAVYVKGKPTPLLIKNRLKENPRGNTEVLEIFWDDQTNPRENDAVPPLLIYADLMATGDPRNIEIAKGIYERHLAGHFGEN